MIDRRELRAGNWVDTVYNTPYIKIAEIKNHVVCGTNCKGISFPSLKPIPLTEEILLKCGFQINGKYYRSKYIQDSIKLIYDFNQRILYFKYKGEFSPMIQIPRAIESLHELQNLYHDLTGEELEVHL